jgi:hypothetical protein
MSNLVLAVLVVAVVVLLEMTDPVLVRFFDREHDHELEASDECLLADQEVYHDWLEAQAELEEEQRERKCFKRERKERLAIEYAELCAAITTDGSVAQNHCATLADQAYDHLRDVANGWTAA